MGLVYVTSYCMAYSTVMYVTVPWTVFSTSIHFLMYFTSYFTLLSVPVAPIPIPCTYRKSCVLVCHIFFCLVTSFSCCTDWSRGTRWHSWLRHCATRRKVSGSIPDGVGIFHWQNPSGRTMALGLTHPLTEVSTRSISWGGKGSRCIGLTTLPPPCADCLDIWKPQPPGTLGALPDL